MTTALTQFADINSLLGADLDDLADLAGFETPPPGSYILTAKFAVKKVNDKDSVEAQWEVVETVELENKEIQPVPPGTKFSTLFMLGHEMGVGNLKKTLKPFAAHFGTGNIGALIQEHLNEAVTVSATIKNRKDKEDPDKIYASVTNVTVA